MRSLSWKNCLTAVLLCWMAFGWAGSAVAQETNQAAPDERLQKLERRVDPLSEQSAFPESLEVRVHQLGGLGGYIAMGFVACNILLAIWIFTDIRRRGDGPYILVVVALLAGIPTAIIYTLWRIGEKSASPAKQAVSPQ